MHNEARILTKYQQRNINKSKRFVRENAQNHKIEKSAYKNCQWKQNYCNWSHHLTSKVARKG